VFLSHKSSLLTYLKMSAWGDYRNLVDKRKRAQQHLVEIDEEAWNRREDVEAGSFEERVALEQGNSLAERLLRQCATSDDDRLVFEMLVEKVRDTETCLQMLGWSSGPESTERLRRAKDRIDKCIKRTGRRIYSEEEQ
jgi:hypothetical protein